MNRTQNTGGDHLAKSLPPFPAAGNATHSEALPSALSERGDALEVEDRRTPDALPADNLSDAHSDAFDLAIQEAVRATTPKRRVIKIVKKVGTRPAAPTLTIEQILAWADVHHSHAGVWPQKTSGPIPDAYPETWLKVESALRAGFRGLPGGNSITRLLAAYRGVRNRYMPPNLSIPVILQWADAHHAQTGKWPNNDAGAIISAPGETWDMINSALSSGKRSLQGGSSLASLLAEYRGVRNIQRLPPLTEEHILLWADAFKEQHGKWPHRYNGPIEGTGGETWTAVALALYRGFRGLPGNTTLPRLLAEHRGAPYSGSAQRDSSMLPLYKPKPKPDLDLFTIAHILARADAWHLHHGKWPNENSGPVFEGAGTTWNTIDSALRNGHYGLTGGSSLPRLLIAQRGMFDRKAAPSLTQERILEWADLHKERTGRWPTKNSGAIPEAPGEKWSLVDGALRDSRRGLPAGASLARVLAEHRGVRNIQRLPDLTLATILHWADNHHARTGDWPHADSGSIPDSPGESWGGINSALSLGYRSLPGSSSLASLLADHRNTRNRKRLPHLSKERILIWADAYREQHGRWPKNDSGPIANTLGETWTGVAVALYVGQRGLPGDTTLPRLLAEFRGAPYQHALAAFSVTQILAWADAWHLRYDKWPNINSGLAYEGADVTWHAVQSALVKGARGLPGGSSLARLLAADRGVRNRIVIPSLTQERILEWADLHKERTGRWPTKNSGAIHEASGEKWSIVDDALRHGRGGLPKGSSLAIMLAEERGRRDNRRTPPLTETQILQWADTYHAQTGKWPTHRSGSIDGVPDETWSKVNTALTAGNRGFARGSSLMKLLLRHGRLRP